jgi:hypothetical protein
MQCQRFAVAALAAAGLLISTPGSANGVQCGDHQSLVKHLGEQFSETLAGTGRDARGRRIELFRSRSGSWTLVLILPEGPACILSAGTDWRDRPVDPPEKDA